MAFGAAGESTEYTGLCARCLCGNAHNGGKADLRVIRWRQDVCLAVCLRAGSLRPDTKTSRNFVRHHPRHNRLLATLPVGAFNRIAPQLELVTMDSGQVLHEPGGRLRHAYFPVTAIVSLLHTLESGASAETAIVGRDGMLGVALLTGGESMLCRAVVQSAGHGYRLKARVLKQEIDRAGALLRLLLRYTQALLTQMAQAALCIRHHSVEQQLCRWLLLRRDRLPSDSMRATQELIAQMLGVRREGVTAAAAKLQRAGV